jgi:outer membrane receptor protein involved in Fe transport
MINNKFHRALLASAVASCFATPLFAQEQTDATEAAQTEAAQNEKDNVERIAITGSRIKRSDIETVTPVVVISAEDISDRGFTTAFDALKNLAQNTGNIQGDEFGSQGGFTPNAQTISLRGLAPGQSLILLNGRRLSENPTPYNGQSNFVNLSSIPVAAIERIEVLTNGASAIYGSDAVAGVVNIILKQDVEDTTVSLLGGTTKDGGGDQYRFQVVSGTTSKDYSITYGAEFQKIDAIFGSDRDWLDSVDDGPAGSNVLARGILLLDAWNGGYVDPGEQLCAQSGSGYERAFREGSGYYCGVDATGDYSIQNEREKYSGFVSGSYQLSDNVELFVDGLASSQEAFNRGFRHFISEYVVTPNSEGTGNLVDLGAPGLDYFLYQRLFSFDELGPKSSNFEEKNYNITAGARGTLDSFYEWELSYSYSKANFESRRDWLKNEKVNELFIGTSSLAFGLPSGLGTVGLYDPITPDIRDELLGTQVIDADSYSRTLFGSISGDLFELPAGYVQFALVAEYNEQGYTLTQDERTLSDTDISWYGLTGTEGGGDRDRWALGLETSIPILETLDATVAARYDKYDDGTSDVGGRLSPMVGLEYRPIESLLLRASYSKSFRAPDMHYVFADNSGFYSNVRDWTTCRNDFVADGGDGSDFALSDANCDTTQIQGTRSGSTTLEEEKGTNVGIGLVYEVAEGLDVTLDYYKIELKDIVIDESISSLLRDEYDCNFNLNDRDPSSGFCQGIYSKIVRSTSDLDAGEISTVNITPTNASRQEISGFDATVSYEYEAEHGNYTAAVEYTNTQSYKYQRNADDDFIEYRNLASFTDPRTNMTAVLAFSNDDFGIALTARRIGTVPIYVQPAEHDDPESPDYGKVSRTHPWITFNLSASYNLTDNSAIRLSGSNIFDNRPPADDTETSWPFYNVFAFPGGAVGAQYFLEYTHTFK